MTPPGGDKKDKDDESADTLPTGRLLRAGKAAGAVGPSSVRFFTTLATNALRSPDDAYAMLLRRHEDIADNTLSVLGELRGGAMKIGQLASFVDVDMVPEEFRGVYQDKLAELRDAAPAMSWNKIKRVLEGEWDEPVESLFEEFDHDAVAAASIGQVHRAVLPGGRRVAVKIQYPEIADALAADLGTAAGLTTITTPLAKAMMPGLDPRMLIDEVRELVMEEIDYELEAQHQRTFARAYRNHPFIFVPDVVTSLSRRRVLVSDWVDGMRFPEIQQLPQEERNRVGEILVRFYFHSMDYLGRFNTDSHPGNFLRREDGSLAFIDFGNVKVVSPGWLQGTKRGMRAASAGDRDAFRDAIIELGYVHRPEHLDVEWLLQQVLAAGEWFLRDQELELTPEYVAHMLSAVMDPQLIAHGIRVARDLKVPTEEVWFRRVEIGVFAVLGQLRAKANWHRIAGETIFGYPPATELGTAERDYFAGRGFVLPPP
ncbi:MAG TPA: AarF/ABC1/UbiB kinase family protein [Solirubrobacteraceae bacterium]|nr:AarF/ABC1/UbiB kinase family protein [Solirubrobacteraceae bacterium]